VLFRSISSKSDFTIRKRSGASRSGRTFTDDKAWQNAGFLEEYLSDDYIRKIQGKDVIARAPG